MFLWHTGFVHLSKPRLIAHLRCFFYIHNDWWNGNSMMGILHYLNKFWTGFILSTGVFHCCLAFGMGVSCSEGRQILKHAVIMNMICRTKMHNPECKSKRQKNVYLVRWGISSNNTSQERKTCKSWWRWVCFDWFSCSVSKINWFSSINWSTRKIMTFHQPSRIRRVFVKSVFWYIIRSDHLFVVNLISRYQGPSVVLDLWISQGAGKRYVRLKCVSRTCNLAPS